MSNIPDYIPLLYTLGLVGVIFGVPILLYYVVDKPLSRFERKEITYHNTRELIYGREPFLKRLIQRVKEIKR